MCNDDWTVTDWYVPTDTVAEGEGGRAMQTLKSVIDVICSSQTSGFVPREEETYPDAFTSQPGCPLGTAPFSWKQLDRNRSPQGKRVMPQLLPALEVIIIWSSVHPLFVGSAWCCHVNNSSLVQS